MIIKHELNEQKRCPLTPLNKIKKKLEMSKI